MGFPFKKMLAAGARALLKKFGEEAEKKIIVGIEKSSDAGKTKAVEAVTKAFDKLDTKSGG
jgi:hypothetical protein